MKSRNGLPGREFALWVLVASATAFSANAHTQTRSTPRAVSQPTIYMYKLYRAPSPAESAGGSLSPREPNLAAASAALSQTDTDLTMPPTIPAIPALNASTITFGLACLDPFTLLPIPHCLLHVDWNVEIYSGGHIHNTNRPKGPLPPQVRPRPAPAPASAIPAPRELCL